MSWITVQQVDEGLRMWGTLLKEVAVGIAGVAKRAKNNVAQAAHRAGTGLKDTMRGFNRANTIPQVTQKAPGSVSQQKAKAQDQVIPHQAPPKLSPEVGLQVAQIGHTMSKADAKAQNAAANFDIRDIELQTVISTEKAHEKSQKQQVRLGV